MVLIHAPENMVAACTGSRADTRDMEFDCLVTTPHQVRDLVRVSDTCFVIVGTCHPGFQVVHINDADDTVAITVSHQATPKGAHHHHHDTDLPEGAFSIQTTVGGHIPSCQHSAVDITTYESCIVRAKVDASAKRIVVVSVHQGGQLSLTHVGTGPNATDHSHSVGGHMTTVIRSPRFISRRSDHVVDVLLSFSAPYAVVVHQSGALEVFDLKDQSVSSNHV